MPKNAKDKCVCVCMCGKGGQLFQKIWYTLRLRSPWFYEWLQFQIIQSVSEYILMLEASSFLSVGWQIPQRWYHLILRWYHLIWPNCLSYLGFSRWTNCASSSPLSTQLWPDCVSLELADTDISTFPDFNPADDRPSFNKMFSPKYHHFATFEYCDQDLCICVFT